LEGIRLDEESALKAPGV